MSFLVTLPVIVPLAAFALALACWRAPQLRGWVIGAGALGSLGAAIALISVVAREGALAVHVGAWPAGEEMAQKSVGRARPAHIAPTTTDIGSPNMIRTSLSSVHASRGFRRA